MKYFDIVTIFPEACAAYPLISILGRAQKKRLLRIAAHDLRAFSLDKKHRKVDDRPYGGGPGMILQVGPLFRAVQHARSGSTRSKQKTRVILLAAGGKMFTQKDAQRLSRYDRLIFLCGRYEGVDARVERHLADETFSIGPYVLTGGELPALVMIDTIARQIPGVLGKAESLEQESHTDDVRKEYPQYTQPPVFHTWRVPPVLRSGNHQAIAAWRKKHQKT